MEFIYCVVGVFRATLLNFPLTLRNCSKGYYPVLVYKVSKEEGFPVNFEGGLFLYPDTL